MKLVVDTNILFSFFRENPVRKTIVMSDLFGMELFIPEYALSELMSNKSEVMKYAAIKSDEDFKYVMSTLEFFVKVKPSEFFDEFKSEAEKISPHAKDATFFALALKLNCCIWSNEPRLKKQSKVKVYSTNELLRELGLNL